MTFSTFISGHPERETVTLSRTSAPSQDDGGVFVAGVPSTSSIVVVTHPVTGEDVSQGQDSERISARIEIYSTEELKVARGSYADDRITRVDGKVYRVVNVDEQKGGVWLSIAVLEDPAP